MSGGRSAPPTNLGDKSRMLCAGWGCVCGVCVRVCAGVRAVCAVLVALTGVSAPVCVQKWDTSQMCCTVHEDTPVHHGL